MLIYNSSSFIWITFLFTAEEPTNQQMNSCNRITHTHTHTDRQKQEETVAWLTSQKSRPVLLLSGILFSSLSILSLLLHVLLICILSHASLAHSLAPGVPSPSYADVCVVTPVTRCNRMPHLYPHPLPPALGRWLCCARFTVATVGWCFRSHYSGPLMTLK